MLLYVNFRCRHYVWFSANCFEVVILKPLRNCWSFFFRIALFWVPGDVNLSQIRQGFRKCIYIGKSKLKFWNPIEYLSFIQNIFATNRFYLSSFSLLIYSCIKLLFVWNSLFFSDSAIFPFHRCILCQQEEDT